MTLAEIAALPVARIAADPAHLYLWVPNALLPEGRKVMEAWGFRYVSNIVWHKVRKDPRLRGGRLGSDGPIGAACGAVHESSSASPSATSPRSCCSACAARTPPRSPPAAARST